MSEISIVDYFSSHDGYKCGYCKSENTCYSHGKYLVWNFTTAFLHLLNNPSFNITFLTKLSFVYIVKDNWYSVYQYIRKSCCWIPGFIPLGRHVFLK